MNRWILRALVTTGFAGAVWAIGTAAASADTTTTPVDPSPVTLVVTLDAKVGVARPAPAATATVAVTVGRRAASAVDTRAPAAVTASVDLGGATPTDGS